MGNGKTPVAHSLQEAKIGSFEGDEALHQRIDRRRDLRQGILSGRLASHTESSVLSMMASSLAHPTTQLSGARR